MLRGKNENFFMRLLMHSPVDTIYNYIAKSKRTYHVTLITFHYADPEKIDNQQSNPKSLILYTTFFLFFHRLAAIHSELTITFLNDFERHNPLNINIETALH